MKWVKYPIALCTLLPLYVILMTLAGLLALTLTCARVVYTLLAIDGSDYIDPDNWSRKDRR